MYNFQCDAYADFIMHITTFAECVRNANPHYEICLCMMRKLTISLVTC
jgi:hypothetical protein